MRNLDAGEEIIEDYGIQSRLRSVAGKVHAAAFLMAVGLTGFIYWVKR